MEHVKDNVYVELISPGCNVGIIATPMGTLIVDTPLVSRQAKAISDELAAAGHEPVRFIVLTHHHGDHILGAGLFGEETLVIGDRLVYENMGGHSPSWVEQWTQSWKWENPGDVREMVAARIPRPHIVFEGELTLHLGDVDVRLLPLPGHVAGSTGVYLPDSRVLITGDALFCDHHPYMGEADLGLWLSTLQIMKGLGAERIIPGHGPVCGNEAIEELHRYMERMVEVARQWTGADEDAVPDDVIGELMAFYPFHGRPESVVRERILESIRVARRTAAVA